MKNTNIKIELDNLKNIQDKSEKIINEVNQILRHSNSSINKFNFDLLIVIIFLNPIFFNFL